MTNTIVTILVTLITTAGTVGIGWFTYRSTRSKDKVQAVISKEANAITFSAQLMERIETLEGRDEKRGQEIETIKRDLEKLGRVFGVAVNYIERFLQWAKDGSRPPIPDIPSALYEHLNPSLIDEHHRQQREHSEENMT